MAVYKKFSKPIGMKVGKFQLDADIELLIQECNSQDALHFQQAYKDDTQRFDLACDIISRSVIDEQGERMFTDVEDVKQNFIVPISQIYKIVEAIYKLSDFAKPDLEGDEEKK